MGHLDQNNVYIKENWCHLHWAPRQSYNYRKYGW